MSELDDANSAILDFVEEQGLVGLQGDSGRRGEVTLTRLTGGVSSDLCLVELDDQSVCVKRSLERLLVETEWTAPVERNTNEWEWIRYASSIVPGAVPTPLAHDAQRQMFAMSYLAPTSHTVWKSEMMRGRISLSTAESTGHLIGELHSRSAGVEDLKRIFDTTPSFEALRIEPYFTHTGTKNPAFAEHITMVADQTLQTRKVLVHGDVSPKNILVGPRGPVLLDAECAWFGDPAFDVAFCLNHLVLKSYAIGQADSLRHAAMALWNAYLSHVDWEPADDLDARVARLLPILLLARVDGRSPVEYLNSTDLRDAVRNRAHDLLDRKPGRTETVIEQSFVSRTHIPSSN
ncbi:aminoglycoside phosphotransferase family protein [Rhodococcus sp. NPDC057014]|uniref:aminoglycoside phosphotransferase family protein n=1 Tax=Rhodococcus sp. NPDC057014 TaxID=3346000 RepID=UPI0036353F9D